MFVSPATSKKMKAKADSGDNSWIQKIPTADVASVKTWSKTLDTKVDHKPFSEQSHASKGNCRLAHI